MKLIIIAEYFIIIKNNYNLILAKIIYKMSLILTTYPKNNIYMSNLKRVKKYPAFNNIFRPTFRHIIQIKKRYNKGTAVLYSKIIILTSTKITM
jgi:hypothetical protein